MKILFFRLFCSAILDYEKNLLLLLLVVLLAIYLVKNYDRMGRKQNNGLWNLPIQSSIFKNENYSVINGVPYLTFSKKKRNLLNMILKT